MTNESRKPKECSVDVEMCGDCNVYPCLLGRRAFSLCLTLFEKITVLDERLDLLETILEIDT